MVIAFLTILLNQPVLAKNAGITIQYYVSPSFDFTRSLTPATEDRLDVCINTDDEDEITEILEQLEDGDILVLSVHSDPSKFGIGYDFEGAKWGRFWEHFGITDPPELAAVIIAGCMARRFGFEGEQHYIPITEPELNFIRRHLNTKILFVPKTTINLLTAVHQADNILEKMLRGDRLSTIITRGQWHYETAPGLDRDICLRDLRRLCREEIPEPKPSPLKWCVFEVGWHGEEGWCECHQRPYRTAHIAPVGGPYKRKTPKEEIQHFNTWQEQQGSSRYMSGWYKCFDKSHEPNDFVKQDLKTGPHGGEGRFHPKWAHFFGPCK